MWSNTSSMSTCSSSDSWDDLKEPADFLAHLKYKAGLPPDFWDAEVKLSRYTVYKWREER